MALPNEHLQVFKDAILAETDQVIIDFVAANNVTGIANWYNVETDTNYVWKPYTDSKDISDVVNWKRMTPEAVADETTSANTRALIAIAQGRVLDILLRESQVNTAKANIRTGVKDALSNLPTRPTSINDWKWSAGGPAALDVMKRKVSRVEALYLAAPGTFATPADLVFDGSVNHTDVAKALALP